MCARAERARGGVPLLNVDDVPVGTQLTNQVCVSSCKASWLSLQLFALSCFEKRAISGSRPHAQGWLVMSVFGQHTHARTRAHTHTHTRTQETHAHTVVASATEDALSSSWRGQYCDCDSAQEVCEVCVV